MSEKTEMVKLTKAKYCFSFFFFFSSHHMGIGHT